MLCANTSEARIGGKDTSVPISPDKRWVALATHICGRVEDRVCKVS